MRAILLAIVLAGGCRKASAPEDDCGALRVTIDGAPMPAMPNGIAFSAKVNGQVTWYVDVSDLDIRCEQLPPNSGRIVVDGRLEGAYCGQR